MENYKKIIDPTTGNVLDNMIKKLPATFIPFDPDNSDYQAYLKWLDEGNTPEPAEEQA